MIDVLYCLKFETDAVKTIQKYLFILRAISASLEIGHCGKLDSFFQHHIITSYFCHTYIWLILQIQINSLQVSLQVVKYKKNESVL